MLATNFFPVKLLLKFFLKFFNSLILFWSNSNCVGVHKLNSRFNFPILNYSDEEFNLSLIKLPKKWNRLSKNWPVREITVIQLGSLNFGFWEDLALILKVKYFERFKLS